MVATVGSVEVYLRTFGVERFQTDMRGMASISEQTGSKVKRSMEGITSSAERASRAGEGFGRSSSAFNSLAISALRAETSITGLSRAFTALGAVVGGLAGGVALNAFKNYADQATNIQNRLAAVVPVQAQRAVIDQQIFETAQRTRTSYESTANIFSRMTLSASNLGATQAQILRTVEITQKALQAGGATTAESASIATQLTQALGAGRLNGDELKSIAENSPVLIQAIAKEFGVGVGALKDLGAEGKLTADRVFKAILNAGEEVDAVFARTTPTIAAGIQQIDNALTRYIGNVDKSIGATKALVGGLEFVARNLDSIGDGAALAVAALAGPLAGRLLTGAGTRAAAPFQNARDQARERVEAANAARQATLEARVLAQRDLEQAEKALKSLDAQPRFRQAAPDVQRAYEDQAKKVDKLREASAVAAEREAAALLKRADAEGVVAQVSQTATNRVQSAKDTLIKRETALNDLIAKRPALEQAAANAGVNVSRRQQGGYYDALYKVVEQRDKLADTNATIALTKRNIEALDEAIARERSSKTASDFIPIAMQRRQAEVDRLPVLAGQRDEQGRILNESEKRLIEAEKKIGDAQATEREKAGKKLADLDNQISKARASVAGQAEKVVAAEVRANDTLIASAEKRARVQADLDAKAIAAATQRRAAQQALGEAEGRLGGLAGQVGTSAAAQRVQAIQQIEAAQSVLNRAHFAEQEALGKATAAASQNSRAKVALAGAARTAGSAFTGLVGLLGGPLGAALTAASVGTAGYLIYQERAAAQVEEHKKAVDRLIDSTKRLNDLNEQGRLRTVQQQVEDAANAAGARSSELDSRNALVDRLRTAQGQAASTGESVLDPRRGPNVTRNLTILDEALRQVGTSADSVRLKLVAGGEGGAAAARQLADALAPVALRQPEMLGLSQEVSKLADELGRARDARLAFERSGANQPQLLDSPLDYARTTAPAFNANPVIEAFKAQIKEVKDQILSLGETDISIEGLDTSREQIVGFLQDIVEARANAMGALSNKTVPTEIYDLVQAFGNGEMSASAYAIALQDLAQKFPSFQPLIASLTDTTQKALAAEGQIQSLGASVRGLDGLIANIRVKLNVDGVLPNISALAAAEQAKADAALNKVEQANRVLALRAAGKDVDAKVLEAQQANPALDADRARRVFAEQDRLNDQISANRKAARGGKGRKSPEQRNEEKLAKKLENLDQDAKVAALNDFDQKTVRFAQSAKVASEQIQAFIAAARSGDMTSIPPTMKEIYDKMRLLEGVKLGKSALDDLFPGRLLAEQIESVRRAAQSSPEIAANLDLIEQRLREKGAPEWAKGFTSSFSDMAKSVVAGTATMATALETFKSRIVNLALDVAFKPFERMLTSGISSAGAGGGSFMDAIKSFLPKFAEGVILNGPGTGTSDSMLARVSNGEAIIPARVVATNRPLVEALVRDRIPAFADGYVPNIGALTTGSLAAQDARMRGSTIAAMPKAGPTSTAPMAVTINNNAPVNVEAREVADGRGGRRLEVQIDEAVSGALARPGSQSRSAASRNPIVAR
ncbi:tape measure protein [Methylorubrum rhodesianum]|uniref:tape measure protein n=1 Tax=Methylorubrum rhodesianum TaxID=29427 RepID=UPI003D29FE4E